MSDTFFPHNSAPIDLEQLYHQDPIQFEKAFQKVAPEDFPGSYDFWQARLEYNHQLEKSEFTRTGMRNRALFITILLGLLAGTIAKLPVFLGIDEEFFYPRFVSFVIFPVSAIYYALTRRTSLRTILLGTVAFLLSAVYANSVPEKFDSDTITLSLFHLPFFLLSITGFVYFGSELKNLAHRIAFIRLVGETLIYTAIVLIGGIILTGLTTALFSAIGVDIHQFYFEWVVVYGASAAPVVATYLVSLQSRGKNPLASLLSRVFAPLFLVTLIGYLIAIVMQGVNLYLERDSLMAFNAMMLTVLAICVFSITEVQLRQGQKWLDAIVTALLGSALIVDIVALSAIIFRLSSYGLTPNRLAVLGMNLVVFVHVAGLLIRQARFLSGKGSVDQVKNWVALYLPVYAIWTGIIVFLFPLMFGYQ